MLFSATQTRKVEDLAKISLKKEPLYVGVDDNKETATVDGLEQVRETLVGGLRSLNTSSPVVFLLGMLEMYNCLVRIFSQSSPSLR